MSTLIGIGKAGINIGKKLKQNAPSGYKLITIGVADEPGSYTHVKFPKKDSYAAYEEVASSRSQELAIKQAMPVEGNVYCIVGSGRIAGCALTVMQHISDLPITLIYVKSEALEFYGEKQKKEEDMIFQVLQEYARCGALREMIVIDNLEIEKLVDENADLGYYDSLNEVICAGLQYKFYFENTEPEFGNANDKNEIARITTLGFCDFETGQERLFYNLKFPRERNYHYSVGKNTNRFDLMKTVRRQMKEKRKTEQESLRFGIYSSDKPEERFCLATACSSIIQGIK